MAITAGMVKDLREMTGAGMMDCKKALTETNGDMDAAVEVLRKSGAAKAEKKASRIAAEGITRTAIDGKNAVVVEVNSETDFVAKNETFQSYVENVAKQALASDASDVKLNWTPMMLEGVKSDAAKVEVRGDGRSVLVSGVSDGSFRLTCTCSNGSKYAEIISELEFKVEEFGKASRSPYELIEACKCSSTSKPLELSFDGGAFTHNEEVSFTFERVDFGSDGADTFEVPIFSFDTELKFQIWDGDLTNGKKLMDCDYKHPSIYNTYNSNVYTLPRRLFGLHTISFVFFTGLSVQGFKFHKEEKAFAKLNALDASLIFGDAFTRGEDSVNGIGNNVVLDFDAMDFGQTPASKITICGRPYVHNTIHVKFSGENGDFNDIVEFDSADGIVEKTFDIHGVKGKNKVSFVFLPGSNFDFHSFRFEK